MQSFTDLFDPLEPLGQGGSGFVFKARNKLDNVVYAVKQIGFRQKDEEFILREIRIHAQISHKNIGRYHQSFQSLDSE